MPFGDFLVFSLVERTAPSSARSRPMAFELARVEYLRIAQSLCLPYTDSETRKSTTHLKECLFFRLPGSDERAMPFRFTRNLLCIKIKSRLVCA